MRVPACLTGIRSIIFFLSSSFSSTFIPPFQACLCHLVNLGLRTAAFHCSGMTKRGHKLGGKRDGDQTVLDPALFYMSIPVRTPTVT